MPNAEPHSYQLFGVIQCWAGERYLPRSPKGYCKSIARLLEPNHRLQPALVWVSISQRHITAAAPIHTSSGQGLELFKQTLASAGLFFSPMCGSAHLVAISLPNLLRASWDMHTLGQGRLVSHRHMESIWKGGFLYEFWWFWGSLGPFGLCQSQYLDWSWCFLPWSATQCWLLALSQGSLKWGGLLGPPWWGGYPMGTPSSVHCFSPCKWGVMVFFLLFWNNMLCFVRKNQFLLCIPRAHSWETYPGSGAASVTLLSTSHPPAFCLNGFLPLVASLKGKSNPVQPCPCFIRPSETCCGRGWLLSTATPTGWSRSSDRRAALALLCFCYSLPCAPSPVLQSIPSQYSCV